MAKKQTRRAISVSRNLYEKLQEFGRAHDIPVSAFAEVALLDALTNYGPELVKAVRDRGFIRSASSMLSPPRQGPRPPPRAPSRPVFKKPIEVRKLESYPLDDGTPGIRIILRDTFDVESVDIRGDTPEDVERQRKEWLARQNYVEP